MRPLTCLATALALIATSAVAEDRPPNAAEAVVIARYKTVVGGAIDRMTAKGWVESEVARVDIADDVQVYDGDEEGPFIFYGDIARSYSSTNEAEAQMQALSLQLQSAKTVKSQQAIIAKIQALAAAASTTPPALFWITTTHNVPTFALAGDDAVSMPAPDGVAEAFAVRPMHVEGGKAYLLEFGEDGRMTEDTANGVWRYDYPQGDGALHIRNIELRLEGDPAFVDGLLKSFDWSAINAALQ